MKKNTQRGFKGEKLPRGIFIPKGSPVLWFRFLAGNGKYIRLPTGTKDIKLACVAMETERNKAMRIDYKFQVEKLPLSKLADAYLKDPEIAACATWKAKSLILNRLVKYFGANTDIRDITVSQCKIYRKWRRENGERKDIVKESSANRDLSELRHAFNSIYDLFEISDISNPVENTEFPSEDENMRMRFLSVEEQIRLLSNCSRRIYPLVYFSLHTGVRQSEALRSEFIHLRDGFVFIPKSKAHKQRHVPLSVSLKEVLQHFPSVSPYIFGREDGAKAEWTYYRKAWEDAVSKSDLLDIHFHDLRHTYASMLIQQGATLEKIQVLLGHKDLKTTQRYAHLVPENLTPEALKLPNLWQSYSIRSTDDILALP